MDCLFLAARGCLEATDPKEKCRLTHAAWHALRSGRAGIEPDAPPPGPIGMPGRPARPRLVPPSAVPARGLGTVEGRAALVHAIAHIELNAIDLAWDAVYRFRGLPEEYYLDWARCADDEARHFAMLDARLGELGHRYGDFDAHNGLWEMAEQTADDLIARMALVPRVLEARGLDVTPGMIARLEAAGDRRTAAILRVILREEVAHVAAGTRWFRWCCARDGREPVATFFELLRSRMRGTPRGPFNLPARREAGFAEAELIGLGMPVD